MRSSAKLALDFFDGKDASTAASQPLTQVSNTAATAGLTSGFGMGPGRTLPL